jgi:GTPase SAR1 family protein
MESSYINICIVGCVSAGKSTILNAFFGQDYAQCKIKRTTMMPVKFIESDDISKINSFEEINSSITETNTAIYKITSSDVNNFKLSDYGNELCFYVPSMEMNVGKKIKLCIYDIPGLNDARTKETYYKYLQENFHKFNIVLFVVDIWSGLNTSDEIDILNFLADNIKKHNKESCKTINMLTIVNKADEMQLNLDDKLEVLGELGEMFTQTQNTVRQIFEKKSINQDIVDCIPICGLDAHLYRMIRKTKDISKLSIENILRIGINDEGSKFRKYSPEEQKNRVQKIIKAPSFIEDMIKLSGFFQIEDYLKKFIETNGASMVLENLMLEFNGISGLTFSNMKQIIKKKVVILEKVREHCVEKYNEEMVKLVKQLNTVVYKIIKNMSNPIDIKKFYDENVNLKLGHDSVIKFHVNPYLNFSSYPSYFADKILELIISEYSTTVVSVSKLSYIDLFENIINFKTEIIDILLESIINNKNGCSTFAFDSNELFYKKIIMIFEKIKQSPKFIEFLRFFLMNFYFTKASDEELILKKLILNKYGEIPLQEFIQDLRIERGINTTTTHNTYKLGLSTMKSDKNNILELYYISKCREKKDDDNFLHHTTPIFIDFYVI